MDQPQRRRPQPLTWIDFAIGAAAGLFVAESPFTPDDTGPSLAIGTVAAAYYLWYRSAHPRQSLPGAARDLRTAAVESIRAIPWFVWPALAAWGLVFAPTLAWMYNRWTGSFWHNNHSMIVAGLILFMARGALRRTRDAPWDLSLWGLPLLAVGLLLAVADASMEGRQVASIGLVVTLPGMSLLFLGRTRTRALRLPLAMSLFLIPVPSLIANHLFLRSVTADWTLAMLHALGISASRYFSQIETPEHVFIVSEACSGFSTLIAAVSLSFFLVAACRSPLRRVALFASIVPLTLAANTLRVLMLVVMSMLFGIELLDTVLHEASGVVTFIVVISALFVIADRPKITEAFG